MLGLLAFSTLVLKRLREPLDSRRSWLIWAADSSKQGIAALLIHFINIGAAGGDGRRRRAWPTQSGCRAVGCDGCGRGHVHVVRHPASPVRRTRAPTPATGIS